MHAALNAWKPYDREPVIFEGVACCIFVEELGAGADQAKVAVRNAGRVK